MSKVNALAIYGIEENSPRQIYELGLIFFKVLGLKITAACYYKYREDRSEEDLDLVDISLSDLKLAIDAGSATSFRLYHESSDGVLWDAGFGYSTEDFGGFYHIDAQGLSSCLNQEKFLEFASEFLKWGSMDYAIFYPADNVADAFDYAAGENFVSVYSCENPKLFRKETRLFEGLERYKKETLRMVYSANVINGAHLEQRVGGCSLQAWILSDASHGSLGQETSGLWFWIVNDQDLEKVNSELGAQGLLISWRASSSSNRLRKIP
ncbi:hypothetical protein ACLUUI_20155 [Enterobacterales bacterium AW_CKDN230030176-1A_HGKHYDSX7]